MNKTTTTTITKKPKGKKKKVRTTVRFFRRQRNTFGSTFLRSRRRKNRRGLAVASSKSFRRIFNITSQDGNSMTVKGRDLVYSIPDTLLSDYQDTSVITMIPSNPCYWIGTRVAALAAGYQNYRPIKFKITYVPQCAVTQQGNVIGGTLWNVVPASDNFQQTLRTSPGGMLTQCYKSVTKSVRMKSNLQFNLFRCSGEFNQESNPFIYLAISVACVDSNGYKIIPGYFYIDYTYTFKNPIGLSHVFYNSGLTTYEQVEKDRENVAIVSCVNKDNLNVGQLIQVDRKSDYNEEEDESQYITTYNSTFTEVKNDTVVWAFSSSSLNYKGDGDDPEPEPEPEPDPSYENKFNYEELQNNITHPANVTFNPRQIRYYTTDQDILLWVLINPDSASLSLNQGQGDGFIGVEFPRIYIHHYEASMYGKLELLGFSTETRAGYNGLQLIKITDSAPGTTIEFIPNNLINDDKEDQPFKKLQNGKPLIKKKKK